MDLKEKTALLIDLDGTLIDSKDGIMRSAAYALADFGIETDYDGLFSFIGPPLYDTFHGRFGLDHEDTLRAIAKYRERFSVTGIREHSLYPGIRGFLNDMVQCGRTLCLATTKPTPYAENILDQYGLRGLFADICGSTMDNSLSAKADIIGVVLRRNSIAKAKAVMIGDKAVDIDGAHANGIDSVGLAYGYGLPGELAAARPTVTVCSVAALAALFFTPRE